MFKEAHFIVYSRGWIMKKIPEMLYHLGITSARENRLNVNIWYRNQLVFEKTGIMEEQIISTIKW